MSQRSNDNPSNEPTMYLSRPAGAVSPAWRANVGQKPSLEMLRAVRLLKRLEDRELETIRETAIVRSAATGEEIFAVGTRPAHVFFVLDGQVRITITAPNGRQVIVRTARAGAHFGEYAVVAGLNGRDTTATTESQTIYIELTAATFVELKRTSLGLCHALLDENASALAMLTDRNFELAALDLKDRLQIELLRLTHGRAPANDGVVLIRPAPTHESIASIIGGTREGITRELGVLALDGLVNVRRREITVLDVARLRANVERSAGSRPTHEPAFAAA